MADKILLIEDDPFFAILTTKMLAPATVRLARHGIEGLAILEQERFDLVITDLVMPEKDGIATIIEFRKRDQTTPVLAMSGGGNLGTQGDLLRLAMRIGATAALEKPFGREQLIAKVRECLARDAAPAAASS
jgi:DNA-binding NtrC family response regulator